MKKHLKLYEFIPLEDAGQREENKPMLVGLHLKAEECEGYIKFTNVYRYMSAVCILISCNT